MSATDERIERLEAEGIIRCLYSTRPEATRYYVFLSKTNWGTTQEHRVSQMKIGEVLSEIESAAHVHGHRFGQIG